MELFTVGKISGTHHLKGAVKIMANVSDAEIWIKLLLFKGNKYLLSQNCKPSCWNKWTVEFQEITNKTDTGKLKNGLIKVRRDILGIAEDEYLLNDLMDMEVVDMKKQWNYRKSNWYFLKLLLMIFLWVEDEKVKLWFQILMSLLKDRFW